ncbi:unnamed protein product [Rotaria magnacalcarata]|uniref:Uncharacterized protein n=1 Tax=Rotaria magnacalcarata TaxID=392030 RepID=A0A816VL64_9BILA|nr:unnamed protein product [Rotaria magnacalcarata]CAF4385849.1 unnamed protein product [Rotaria magnacalcarata]
MDINDEFVEITRPIRVLLHPKYLRHRLRKKHSIDEQSTMSATTVEQLDIAEDDNDEPETEWLDETGEEETGHMDDDESEMDASQDDEQVEYVERRKTPDSDEDEEMSY